MYLHLFRFVLPLVITELAYEFGLQVLNGGIVRMPQATATLAAYGLAWGITSLFASTVSQTRQMSMVLVKNRAAYQTTLQCVIGFGGIHALLLAGLAFTPVGTWVVDDLHGVDQALGDVVREALSYLLPIPVIVGVTRFYSGLLLRVRRTDVISYAMTAAISMSILSVFLLLSSDVIQSKPILLPLFATYAGALTECGVIFFGYRRFARQTLSEADESNASSERPPLTRSYALRFYWPLAATIGIQGASRPTINLFVARGMDGTESLAILTIVYALAHLPYGWLNELKNLPAAFQHQDPTAHTIRRFSAMCGLLSFTTMIVMFWTPVRTYLLETLLGVGHDFAVLCHTPLVIFSFFPLAVMIRAHLHGLALRDHRTGAMAPSGPARIIAIITMLNVLTLFDIHGAARGVAALLSGFVIETSVVWWGITRRKSAKYDH
jgi:hypothetical protein